MLIRLITPRDAKIAPSGIVRAWLTGQLFHEAGTRNAYSVYDAMRLARGGCTGIFFPQANCCIDINPLNVRGF